MALSLSKGRVRGPTDAWEAGDTMCITRLEGEVWGQDTRYRERATRIW